MTVQEEILAKAHKIPPLSESAEQLMELMGKREHQISQIVTIVQCDAALTAKVLRVVNSAMLSLAEPITSVARAVSYLGDKMVLGIALESCARDVYQKPLEGYASETGVLWQHNLRAAIASKEVARYAREGVSPDLAFTGGLLHDIGKSVLSEFLQETASELAEGVDKGTYHDYLAAEEGKLGTNHCVIGAELAQVWKLPAPLVDVIRHHHHPREAEEGCRGLVYIVHLGDFIAMLGGTGTGSDTLSYHMDDGYTDFVDVGPESLTKIMVQVEDEFSRNKQLLIPEKEE
ncbi:HDOD domain-containing protein [Thermodesulfobacteriota bacterium]